MNRYAFLPVIALAGLMACTSDPNQSPIPGATKAPPSAVPSAAVAPTPAPSASATAAPATASALSAKLTLDGKPMTFNLDVVPPPAYSGSSVMWALGKFGNNGPDNAYVLATVYTSVKSAQTAFATTDVTSVKLQVNPSAALSVSFIGTPGPACSVTVNGNTADIHYKGPFNVFDGKTMTTQPGEFDATGLKLR